MDDKPNDNGDEMNDDDDVNGFDRIDCCCACPRLLLWLLWNDDIDDDDDDDGNCWSIFCNDDDDDDEDDDGNANEHPMYKNNINIVFIWCW